MATVTKPTFEDFGRLAGEGEKHKNRLLSVLGQFAFTADQEKKTLEGRVATLEGELRTAQNVASTKDAEAAVAKRQATDAEAARQKAVGERDAANTARQTAEGERDAAKTVQKTAEGERDAAKADAAAKEKRLGELETELAAARSTPPQTPKRSRVGVGTAIAAGFALIALAGFVGGYLARPLLQHEKVATVVKPAPKASVKKAAVPPAKKEATKPSPKVPAKKAAKAAPVPPEKDGWTVWATKRITYLDIVVPKLQSNVAANTKSIADLTGKVKKTGVTIVPRVEVAPKSRVAEKPPVSKAVHKVAKSQPPCTAPQVRLSWGVCGFNAR